MCSGGEGYDYAYAERLANISKIKASQKAQQDQVNVVLGGEAEEYRLNLETGGKDVGMSDKSTKNLKLSNLFTKNIGKRNKRADEKAWRLAHSYDFTGAGVGVGVSGEGGQGNF